MPTNIQNPFTTLPIWEHFLEITKELPDERTMVAKHIEYALPLLERIPLAFPFYTLHNSQHQYNILHLIGEIMGPRLQELTCLETAMVILSALYHDIGMVYSPADLEKIISEPEFHDFLVENTSANLQFEENGKKPTEGLINWYCRWAHAKRVWPFLQQVDASIPIVWEGVPFRDELGNICESHNEPVDAIKNDDSKFSNSFLGKCDLKFCALLLRLGDILDFDDTRSPRGLYEFLGLDKAKRTGEMISNEEWRKHMSAKGFTIDRTGKRPGLRFIAVPEHPKVEVGIRDFLKIIENELNACAKLLHFCSPRWSGFELPEEINLEGIKSKNYRSGNYHFSLAENDVMKLLTGEGIYNDDYIFLRELLQNAIDTSRHREFRERLTTAGFQASPIVVSNFTDQEGYQWIRIDDFGMGMTLEIIEKHLLKKGQSYYNSDSFKLEKLAIKEKVNADFVPISRFGIGLLSCFIAGDKIEINTVHKYDLQNPYRLSVEGRNGFFTLQSKKERHTPPPMPAEYGPETGFRQQAGTSIAVRITTNKEYEGFDVKRHLEKYLMAPPVPVKYDGVQVGGDFELLTNGPWATAQSFDLAEEFVERVRTLTDLPFEKGIKVSILPISLTNDALSPNIKGQLVITYIDINGQELGSDEKISFTLESHEEKQMKVRCTRRIQEGSNSTERQETLDVSSLLQHLQIPKEITSYPYYYNPYHLNSLRFSHNGIMIPSESELFALNRGLINNHVRSWGHMNNFNFICTGLIYFQDELLPKLTVSRNEVREMTYPTIAHMLSAMRALNGLLYVEPKLDQYHFFDKLERDVSYTSGDIKQSRFYDDNRNFWNDRIEVSTVEGTLSIRELKDKSPQRLQVYVASHSSRFYQTLVNYVLEENFDIEAEDYEEDGYRHMRYFISKRSMPLPEMVLGFDPLTFVDISNSSLLKLAKNINVNHKFVKWYAAAYPILKAEYFHYSKQLIYGLYGNYGSIRPDTQKINRILEKLRSILPPDLSPPKDIELSLDDFGIKD